MNGTIKRLKNGFGFIRDASGQDHFFHASAVQQVRFDDLREGQAVEFETTQGNKGPRAEQVVPVQRAR